MGRAFNNDIVERNAGHMSPGERCSVEAEGAKYDRDSLLFFGKIMRFAGDACDLPGFTTTRLTESEPHVPDPCLDDEVLVAALEARLSRESGADAHNFETFGDDCAGGWSFEAALEANEQFAKTNQRNLQPFGDFARRWGCDGIPEADQLLQKVRPCGWPFGSTDSSISALRERGRQVLGAAGLGLGHGQRHYWESPLGYDHADHHFSASLAATANARDPCFEPPHATESNLRADAPRFEPQKTTTDAAAVATSVVSQLGLLSTVSLEPAQASLWRDCATEPRKPFDSLNAFARCFEPGTSYAFECVSTDDTGESCGVDSVASGDGDAEERMAETMDNMAETIEGATDADSWKKFEHSTDAIVLDLLGCVAEDVAMHCLMEPAADTWTGLAAMPSVGSRGHYAGSCKPCAFFLKEGAICANGAECFFCHLCEPGEKKKRKQEMKKARGAYRQAMQTRHRF
jgi:hypothetical protein